MNYKISIEGMISFIAGIVILIVNKVINGTYMNKITVLSLILFIVGVVLMWMESVENEEEKGEEYPTKPVHYFKEYGE